jgi:hypothetical protein
MKVFLATPILALALFSGCYSAAPAGEHSWTIRAPSKVALETKLSFTVEAHAPDGTAVAEVPYVWKVEWVSVEGTRHQGKSSHEEHIKVKGTPGTATLRILAYGPDQKLVEVAHATFEVTPAQAPAH